MLPRSAYPCEYTDSWQRFNKMPLPNKKKFYSNLIMEHIKDVDCKYAKRVWEEFRIQTLGEYHDLYVQSSTLLLTDVYEK